MGKIRALPDISNAELRSIMRKVLLSYPELHGWIFWVSFRKIDTYGWVDVQIQEVGNKVVRFGIVKINQKLKTYTRRAVESIIAHELAHVLFINKKCAHTEGDVAQEVIARGFRRGITELFFSDCPSFCNGQYKKNIGGVYCKPFCPWRLRLEVGHESDP